MTLILLFSSVAAGSASLAIGYFLSSWSGPALAVIVLGALWLVAEWRRWRGSASVGLVAAALAGAYGLLLGIHPAWMFAGVLFSLAAWDLSEFRERMRLAANENDAHVMEKRHLVRLGYIALAGTVLAALTGLAHWQFSLGWLAVLALLAGYGMTQLVQWFRQQ